MSDNEGMSGLIGKKLGQFEIVEEIGRGGMATVFKANQASVGRLVALKVLPTQFAHDPTFVQRFQREARAIANLEHPHILPLYDFGTQDGLTYMAMRYIRGGDLSNLMGQNLSAEKVVEIVSNVARALDYAHKNGVIHRDIKPSNILIDDNGEVLLTDFGIAKTADSQLTGTGMVLGTPDYMAPEQIEGIADPRSDIYALGVVLYELLTGEPPYRAETPLATALKHMNEAIPLPHDRNPNVREPLERIVLKAMAKNPDERYQTGGDMARALKDALSEIDSTAPTVDMAAALPATRIQPKAELVSAAGSRSLLFVGGGVAVLIVVMIGIVFLVQSFGSTDEATAVSPSTPASLIEMAEEATDAATEEANASLPLEERTSNLAPAEPATTFDRLLDGDVLLQDSFNSNDREWTTLEYEADFGFYSAQLVNGRYRLSREAAKDGFNWEEPAAVGSFDNFIATIEAIPTEDSDPFRYGLAFRSNPAGFYTFELSNEGQFRIRVNDQDGWHTLVEETALPAIKNEEANQVAVQADGPILTFFINGEEAITVEDSRFENGKIGVLIDVEAGNTASVDYDNFIVRELSPSR